MIKKELEHFILEEEGNRIDVKFKSPYFDSGIEREIIGLLHTAYFGIQADIRIFLQNIEYVNHKVFLTFLNLAKEMNASNRHLTLREAPESLQRFIYQYQLEEILHLEN